MAALVAPEIVVFAHSDSGNPGTFEGLAGLLAWTAAWDEAWETFINEPIDVEPIGERTVFVRARQTGRGAGSGVEVSVIAGWVFQVGDDGKATRVELYQDAEMARDAALALAERSD